MLKRSVMAALLLASLGLATRLDAALVAPKDRPIRVAVVLTDGATMIDFAGPWEVFQDVMIPERGKTMDEQMPFQLFTVGGSRQPAPWYSMYFAVRSAASRP